MRTLLLSLVGLLLTVGTAHAGGGPMNVMVLYNADEPEAASVAEHYRQARALPAAHLCPISGVDPTLRNMDFADFETLIHDPVVACLQAATHPQDIDYLVVVRGLPYRINLPGGEYYTSLSAMLQVHEAARTSDAVLLAGQPQFHNGSNYQTSIDNPSWVGGYCQAGDLVVVNQYSGSYQTACSIVRATDHPASHRRVLAGIADGYDFAGNLFVVTRLDGFGFDDARDLVDRAVAADGTFPAAELLCMEASDAARGARDPECEFTARHLDLAGFTATYLSPFDGQLSGHTVAAYFTGTAGLRDGIDGQTYAPGAITCNLTSYGAAPTNFFCNSDSTICPESESQTSIARFVRAGATGAHGTVAEPLNNCFPSAGTLLHYTFGYNLGESYFFNQRYIYWQNLYLGDPLTTPYAERPVVTLTPAGEVPHGSTLTVEASHPDGIAGIRLYVDDERVAEGPGATLDWIVDREVGSALDVLAVAVAENGTVQRPGWPVESHTPKPDVQGWLRSTITVGNEVVTPDGGIPDDGGLVDDGGVTADASTTPSEDDGGCGCRAGASGGTVPVGFLLVLVVGLLARRRRRRGATPPR